MPEQPTRYLTSTEAAKVLNVAPKTVTAWAAAGKLPFQRTLGGHRRFNEADLRAIVDAHTVPATVPLQQ